MSSKTSDSFSNIPRRPFGVSGLLCATVIVLFAVALPAFGRTREKAAPSFTIDVDKPFEQVVPVVEDVARGGVIRGTFEYAGDEQLEDAKFSETSKFFPAWNGDGKIFYKYRERTLAPKHFIESNDVGTVAVRYVVQNNGPNATRLTIDAVFVENGGHHGHPSDGYVETCEFAEIGKRLKDFKQQTHPGFSSEFSSSKEGKPAPTENGTGSVGADIRRAIADQKDQLATEIANLQKLEDQSRQFRTSEFVRIRAERAELKASPYSHARVIEALKQGQEVTVLAKSTYWFRVRSEDGQEGWLHHSVVEVQP
jgi:SH3 domain-containing protein